MDLTDKTRHIFKSFCSVCIVIVLLWVILPHVAHSQSVTPATLVLMGYHDLGGGGFNTDVWVHEKHAYVGTWGTSSPDGMLCPATGTKVIDVSDPRNPVQINTLPSPPGTRINDVKAAKIKTDFFQGDLLVVSNEDCGQPGARGVELWDITNPGNPLFLARFGPKSASDGPEFLDLGMGVHNVFLYQKEHRALLLLAVDLGEIFQSANGLPLKGDLRILDVTNPKRPVEIASWGLKQDLGEPVGMIRTTPDEVEVTGEDCRPVCRGESKAVLLHDVWANDEGTVAYLSYWDAGLILLDISDPFHPTFIGRGTYGEGEEGNTHAAVVARDGDLVLVTDEDFSPGHWGFLRIFDTSIPTNPVQTGSFGTPNTFVQPPPDEGNYTIHNVMVHGDTAFISWYSDGIQVVDFSDPSAPRHLAHFVPPDLPDANGFFPAKALVWGVFVHEDLVFASDINSGLYVLKLEDK